MSSSIIITIVVLIWLVLRGFSKKSGNPAASQIRQMRTNIQNSQTIPKAPVTQPAAGGAGASAGYSKNVRQIKKDLGDDSRIYKQMEDRKNDWMAKQLRDEKIAYYAVRRMFDFKYDAKTDHMENCDARAIKTEHHANCDADRRDTGAGR